MKCRRQPAVAGFQVAPHAVQMDGLVHLGAQVEASYAGAMAMTLTRPGATADDSTVTRDPDTGELSGPMADVVMRLIQADQALGYVVSHPVPTTYTITNPLRDPRQMAAILSMRWRLPGPLADAVDPPAEDVPADVPVLY